MTDEMALTLNSPLTDEQWDAITDVDFDRTDRIWFHTKHGKEVEFAKVVRCKDCKYLPGKSRAYADDDPVETYIHCGHLGENGYCSFAKMDDDVREEE